MQAALSAAKETAVIRITVLAWLAAKFISWRLWLPYRLFPTLPVFHFLDFPDFSHTILAIASVVMMVLVLVFPARRYLLWIVVVFEVLSCLLDVMRWQPWQYQFMLTFVLFCLAGDQPKRFLSSFGFLLCATYLYSALHKFSDAFLQDVWLGFLLKGFGLSESFGQSAVVYYSGYVMGVVELAIGLGLLLAKNKKPFVWLCIAMHVGILLALGPIGIDANAVVWPWNVAMAAMVWVVFFDNGVSFSVDFMKPLFHKVVVVWLGMLPALNFIGLWDDYLSFAMYAGGNEKMLICFENDKLPAALQKYKTAPFCGDDETTISITKWSFKELEVPVYPEERAYRAIKKRYTQIHPGTADRFIIYDFPYRREDVRAVE
ncbi:hypothetical protein [Flavobacterium caeni]|uniref:Vitamin K-dependent gamma-carboxylase n=1 Tax=Flavobacterium caeni TaxID=490189 RepID=A0A1G5D251_9FLAO|nr:hypothetical protein [Flavobacterium caeni]SCY08736.1 hypothetical protein SAMN02927903_00717 [Flavobacterium caeni]